MERETLLERLRGIEWADLEVKEAAGGVPKTAYTTVSAFANSSGGWIVFGVREAKGRFEITGVTDPDKMQNEFLGSCRDTEKFSRHVEVRPHYFVIEGHPVLAFYVAPARRFDKPIRVRVDKAWFTYIRVAARDQKCTEVEEGRFLRDASAESFDIQPLPEASPEDLDPASLRWARGLYRTHQPGQALEDLSDTEFLEELGLVKSGRLTIAAALLFGRGKLIAWLKPGGLVDFRLIRQPWSEEVPAHRYDDRLLCETNLIETVRLLTDRFLNLVPNPFALDPYTMERRPLPPEFPALREALVNLLIHQDYSDQHRTARVLWYTDRTFFDNPGDSYVSLVDMLEGGASDLRNPRLARLMRQFGFAEQAGTGIPTIVKTWRQVERTPPEVVNEPGRKKYALILNWGRLPKRDERFWKERLGASVSPDELRILDWLWRVGVAERMSVRIATGTTVHATRKMVDRLLDLGLVVPVDEEAAHLRLASHIVEILETGSGQVSESTEQVAGLTEQVTQFTEQVTEQVTGTTEQVAPDGGLRPAAGKGNLAQDAGRRTADAEQVTEQVRRLVSALGEAAASSSALMAALGLQHRPTFLYTYLQPALALGLIEMTLPDKPRSSRQQYRLTAAGKALLARLHGASR